MSCFFSPVLQLSDFSPWQANWLLKSYTSLLFCFSPKSLSVAVMPAKKTTTKRKSDAVVEDDKDLKKVKSKSLVFSKTGW